jgi:hypothetical protein
MMGLRLAELKLVVSKINRSTAKTRRHEEELDRIVGRMPVLFEQSPLRMRAFVVSLVFQAAAPAWACHASDMDFQRLTMSQKIIAVRSAS